MFSIDAGEQRVAQRLLPGGVEHAVVPVGDLEHILGALAEGGDARIVHAQSLRAQGLGDVGERAEDVFQITAADAGGNDQPLDETRRQALCTALLACLEGEAR